MSINGNINQKANLIWSIADVLTGTYKPHEYGEVILPMMVIKRFDCILEDTKEAVLKKLPEVSNLPMKDIFLKKASGQPPRPTFVCIKIGKFRRKYLFGAKAG